MAIRRNKKFIDPRYFMNEKMEVIEEDQDGPPGPLPPDVPRGFGGVAHGALGQPADPIVQAIINIAMSPKRSFHSAIIQRFEETLKKLEDAANGDGPGEWAPDDDIIGLAATLFWFTRVTKGSPARIRDWEQIRKVPTAINPGRGRTSRDYRTIRDTVFGRYGLQDMREMMNTMEELATRYWLSANKASADLGPVAGAAGMSPAAQEWGYMLKVLKGGNDDPTAQQAFKTYGRPYLEKVVAAAEAPTT
jgi:hypothetical protein